MRINKFCDVKLGTVWRVYRTFKKNIEIFKILRGVCPPASSQCDISGKCSVGLIGYVCMYVCMYVCVCVSVRTCVCVYYNYWCLCDLEFGVCVYTYLFIFICLSGWLSQSVTLSVCLHLSVMSVYLK